MHEAEVIFQIGRRAFGGHIHKRLGNQPLPGHRVHALHRLIGILFHTGVVHCAVRADIEVILAGFQAAHAKQRTGKAEHIDTALVVVVLAGEQALYRIGAVECLRVGNHAAQQRDKLVGIPCRVLSDKQVGAVGAVVAEISVIDVLAEHVDRSHAVNRAGHGVHIGNDVAHVIIILGDGFGAAAVGGHNLNVHLARSRHIRLVRHHAQRVACAGGKRALAVEQLLDPVHAHQRHTLDVVYAVKVRAEVDGAGIGIAGDGQPDDRVGVQICLEIRHHVEVLGDIDDRPGLACLGQLQGGAAHHIDFVQAFLPVVEFLVRAVALVFVLKSNAKGILYLNPGRPQLAAL